MQHRARKKMVQLKYHRVTCGNNKAKQERKWYFLLYIYLSIYFRHGENMHLGTCSAVGESCLNLIIVYTIQDLFLIVSYPYWGIQTWSYGFEYFLFSCKDSNNMVTNFMVNWYQVYAMSLFSQLCIMLWQHINHINMKLVCNAMIKCSASFTYCIWTNNKKGFVVPLIVILGQWHTLLDHPFLSWENMLWRAITKGHD